MKTDKLKTYHVYKHTCPNNKVYIGITCQKPYKRWKYGNSYKGSPHFNSAIKKYGWENIKHEILFTGLTKEQAEKEEIKLIALYKSNQREFGYNIQSGGNCGDRLSESTKRIIGEKAKMYMTGKVGRLNGSSKVTIKMDIKTNKVLGIYESACQAAVLSNLPNGAFTHVCRCCRGQLDTAYGFKWKYADKDILDNPNLPMV